MRGRSVIWIHEEGGMCFRAAVSDVPLPVIGYYGDYSHNASSVARVKRQRGSPVQHFLHDSTVETARAQDGLHRRL